MHRVLVSTIVFTVIFAASESVAQNKNEVVPTIRDYIENLNSELEDSLADIGRGIETANLWLKIENKQPIYCPPEGIVLTGRQYGQILKNTVKSNPSINGFAIQYTGMALLTGLKDTFPCSGDN